MEAGDVVGAAEIGLGAKSGSSGVEVRFALYGRMSTKEIQDRETSLHWQREVAEETIAGRGAIMGEFFDEGCSRRLSWWQRPAAAALLASITSGAREFDAVVVGEYERAFCGEQFRSVMDLLRERGVELWLPEVGGPVEAEDPTHQALMMLLGAQSRREVVRARHRVLAAMRVQAGEQGRFLGGRPPYGFRLVDGGPHPNRAHARWGRRRRRLDPDPDTAPWVRWIFEQRASGRSVAGLARELNERGVRCPSGADRVRNPHRPGQEWMVRTVTGILENPRYTGREVWNRRSTEGRGGDHARRAGGAVRRTQVKDWVLSDRQVHPALVSDELFLAVQGMRTARRTHDGNTRRYALAGLLVCEECGRRLDSHWGQWSRWIPLPARLHQRPRSTTTCGQECLRPGGQAARRTLRPAAREDRMRAHRDSRSPPATGTGDRVHGKQLDARRRRGLAWQDHTRLRRHAAATARGMILVRRSKNRGKRSNERSPRSMG